MTTILLKTFSNVFFVWKLLYFDWNFTEISSKSPIHNNAGIGWDNGLAPNRWQAIIWTNDGLVYCCIYESLGLDEIQTQFQQLKGLVHEIAGYFADFDDDGLLNENELESLFNAEVSHLLLDGGQLWLAEWLSVARLGSLLMWPETEDFRDYSVYPQPMRDSVTM